MNHWAFVTAAYTLTGLATGAVSLASWRAMRAIEKTPVSSPVGKPVSNVVAK